MSESPTSNMLSALAEVQDRLWGKDAEMFCFGELDLPVGYLVWTGPTTRLSRFPLGPAPSKWPVEIFEKSTRSRHSPTAVVTVGMGTMLSLKQTEEDAQTLLSLSAGLNPSDVEGARPHLISHLKTTSPKLPDRVIGAPLDEEGDLGALVDSGFTAAIVDRAG